MKLVLISFIFICIGCSSPDNPVGCFQAINTDGNVITYGCGDLRTWEKFKMFPVYDQSLPDGYMHYAFKEDCKCN